MLSASILASLESEAAALLKQSDWRSGKTHKMAQFSPDDDLLFEPFEWDCDGCPPPVFNIPPPPRPPWLEDLDDCDKNGGHPKLLEDILSQLETCDNTIIRDSQSYFDETFHSIAVIVVSALVLVIILLVAAVMVFKRRKRFYHHSRECHPAHPLVNDHQFLQKDLSPDHRDVQTLNSDCSVNGSLFGSLAKARQALPIVTALAKNGQTVTTMSRCCGNLEAHFQRHYMSGCQSTTNCNCLPNHYIQDVAKAQTVVRLQDGDSIKNRFLVPVTSERKRTVMELSERPPAPRPQTVYQVQAHPHIIIGGKPFYLIPTTGDPVIELENYAYPPQMPIYEEIDGSYCSSNARMIHEQNSEMECSSEQGEVGSVDRFGFQRSPRLFSTNHHPFSQRSPLHRPLSSQSASHNSSSQQTNTSEVSSTSSSSASSSTSNPNLDLPSATHSHYVLLDPEDEDRGRKRPPPLYENGVNRRPSPKTGRQAKFAYSPRLADGVERSRSPQSIYASRLAQKNSPGRSVYYYSDTLKKDRGDQPKNTPISMSELSETDQENSNQQPLALKSVSTKVVLEDTSIVDKKSESTLV